MPRFVLSSMKYQHAHGIVHRDVEYVAPPLIIDFRTFGDIFESIPWLVNTRRTSSSVPRTHRRISLSPTLACASLGLLIKNVSCVSFGVPVAKHLDSSWESLTSVARRLGYVAPEVLNERGHCKPIELLVNGVRLLPTPTNHVLQKHHLRPPCGYTQFEADEMNEMIQQTTGGRGRG
jgi:serine/threonine protein kinase